MAFIPNDDCRTFCFLHKFYPAVFEYPTSASEMTYIVSSGALNSTHSLEYPTYSVSAFPEFP